MPVSTRVGFVMANSNSTSVTKQTYGNVMLFPGRISGTDVERKATLRTTVAPVVKLRDFEDAAATLARVAPWVNAESPIINAWHSSPFFARLASTVESATGESLISKVVWKGNGDGKEIRGRVATPFGNVLLRAWTCFRGTITAELLGHRDALIWSGVAQPHWLHTESRQGCRNDFPADIFGAERTVNVTKNGVRYSMQVKFTDEESQAVNYHRMAVERAREGAIEESKRLPSSRSDYLDRLQLQAQLYAHVVERMASEGEGGYSLSDASLAALRAQLAALQLTISSAVASYSGANRERDITRIANEFSPTT